MDHYKNGWVKTIKMDQPSLKDNTADADRLIRILQSELKTKSVIIDFELLKSIPDFFRKYNYHIKCVLFKDRNQWIVVGFFDVNYYGTIAGLAVDLGTTRISLRLLDIQTKNILSEITFNNPQIQTGSDILTRIHFADKNGLIYLNKLIIDGLNENISKLCNACSIKPDDIMLISLAGNTSMTHFFLNLNPHYLIREPYIPVINTPGVQKAIDLGIKVNNHARILIFPNIGSYFGGDLISGILYSGLYKSDGTSILVDVGTNAEVVLGNKNWMIGCAGAAGPALEGGVTEIGIAACPGAIDKVEIDSKTKELKIHTIDNLKPCGICGSGLIDLAAQLFSSGFIDMQGKFVFSQCKDKLIEKDEIKHFIIVNDLTISQIEIDSLTRSKAAMYSILETIISTVGISFSELSYFYVAGAFGCFINPKAAITIGMLPDLPAEKYKPLGNSSLEGACLILTSNSLIDEIYKIREKITYLELNVNQEFMQRFSAAKFYPHTNRRLL